MSNRYKGGVISATPPTLVAGAGASGTWTLEQQMQATAAGLWPVNGPFYIEDVFSTYLYTGNGSTQTITNGIDLSGKGGLYWWKVRNIADSNYLVDTTRGATKWLVSNSTGAEQTVTTSGLAFNNSGVSFNNAFQEMNQSGNTFTSWTFRKQPKFFDVVTYTGDGVAGRQIAHNLGSAPGCIIIKNYSGTDADVRVWGVWHRTLAEDYHLTLNSTAAQTLNTSYPLFGKPAQQTSTYFTVGQSDATGVNATTNGTGLLYVAYLFAHDAGGFGLTGTDNVISCGSYTGNGSATGPVITLGYEPQYVLIKNASAVYDWYVMDSARQICTDVDDKTLSPNSSAAEAGNNFIKLTATGFQPTTTYAGVNTSGSTYIYITIRRPMKVPTSGDQVFDDIAYTANNTANRYIQTTFSPDMVMGRARARTITPTFSLTDRFFGNYYLRTGLTNAEAVSTSIYESPYSSYTSVYPLAIQNGYGVGTSFSNGLNYSTDTVISYAFKRAAGFMDTVCYTGTGVAKTETHNLGVAPELMIVKGRSGARAWTVYHSSLGATKYIEFDTSAAFVGSTRWNDTAPTSSVFTVGTAAGTNVSTETYVAYLFATCAGVSKVGSYTGTGTTLQVNCGFTGGARFVLIKRTDATGDWYVWDSARGIVAGDDPYLLINSSAAEVTNTDYVDTYSAGFEISSTAPAAINASGGTFIFLAIA